MKFFCDVISKDILPKVRAGVARTMFFKYGWSQERIAGVLGITQAAVSQYIKYKRVDENIDVDELCDFIVSHGGAQKEVHKAVWKFCVDQAKKRGVFVPSNV